MMKAPSCILAALAAGTVATASPALAQVDQLDPAAVEAASRYALPIVFDAYIGTCAAELDPAGYALSNSQQLSAKFSDGSSEAWPGAKQALIAMASQGEGNDLSPVIEAMGDEGLRSFVDALIGIMVGSEIKVEDCETIERGLEIVDPLPADNVAQLIGFVVEMGQRSEANQDDGEWKASE